MSISDGVTSQASFYSDASRLHDIKPDNKDPESINKIAKEFEAIFIQMTLKSMREAQKSLKSDLLGSNAMDSYEEMYDKQMAHHLSQSGGVGLAEVIAKQFAPQQELPDEKRFLPATLPQNIVNRSKTIGKLTIVEPEFNSPDDFISAMKSDVEKFKHIIDPGIIIAQSALETGWGKKIGFKADGTSSNNLFGIKVNNNWDGDSYLHKTTEYRDGVLQVEKDNFRAYESRTESIQDYIDFISSNPRYSKALASGQKPYQYAKELQLAGYATDPNYAAKIVRVYDQVRNSL